MGILDWLSNQSKKLKEVENKIDNKTNDVYEIYQKNLALEREIAQRTEELRLANQTLLTLEQVWDMMNSSRPLSSVLETIVSSLYGEFGYIYSFIAQREYENNNIIYSPKTYLENDFILNLTNIVEENVFDFRLYPKQDNLIENAIKNKKITFYRDIKDFIDENIKDPHTDKLDYFYNIR